MIALFGSLLVTSVASVLVYGWWWGPQPVTLPLLRYRVGAAIPSDAAAATRHCQLSVAPAERERCTWVVLSTDTTHARYATLAPLTVLMWRRLGVQPIVVVGTRDRGPYNLAEAGVLAMLRTAGAEVLCLAPDPSFPPDTPLTTLLQLVRLTLPLGQMLREDDVIVTSDADLWPLSPKFWTAWLAHAAVEGQFAVYDGPFYFAGRAEGSDDRLAIACLAAPVDVWHRLLYAWPRAGSRATPRDALATLVAAGIVENGEQVWARGGGAVGNDTRASVQWSWDQRAAWYMLRAAGLCARTDCHFNRDVRRLDRAWWPLEWDARWAALADLWPPKDLPGAPPVDAVTDAHLPDEPITRARTWGQLAGAWVAAFGSVEPAASYRTLWLQWRVLPVGTEQVLASVGGLTFNARSQLGVSAPSPTPAPVTLDFLTPLIPPPAVCHAW